MCVCSCCFIVSSVMTASWNDSEHGVAAGVVVCGISVLRRAARGKDVPLEVWISGGDRRGFLRLY